jgi:mRNA-degrading endonuclease toxin of MazEF toxin-antitoxin module
MNPKWLTWDRDGSCSVSVKSARPKYIISANAWLFEGGTTFLVPLWNRKRGGPKAIRRIRLEKS